MNRAAVVFIVAADAATQRLVREVGESLGWIARPYATRQQFIDDHQPAHRGCIVTEENDEPTSGPEFMEQLGRSSITLPVIVLADQPSTALIVHVMKHGAVTVLDRPYVRDEVSEALTEAIARCDREQEVRLKRRLVHGRMATLTDSERKVMELMIDGMANKVIAKRLKLSVRTVESRRHEVFAKMEVRSLAELVRIVVSAR